MVQVTIRIPPVDNKPAWTYSREVSIPTRPPIVLPPEPPVEIKLPTRVEVKTLREAFNGQTVPVLTTVVCGGKASHGDTAQLIVENEILETKKTTNGTVDFEWTAVPGIHTLCVKIPQSKACKMEGQDCVQISVSSEVPEILERLKQERQVYRERLEELKQRRERIRREIPMLRRNIGSISIQPLTVDGEPLRGVPITLDGKPVGTTPTGDTPIEIPDVPAGEHLIVIHPPGKPPIEIPVIVQPGKTVPGVTI